MFDGTIAAFARHCGMGLHNLFAAEQIPVRFACPPYYGARTLTYAVYIPDNQLRTVMGFEDRIAMRCGARLTRVARADALVVIEIELPKPLWQTCQLSSLPTGRGRDMALGLDTRNHLVGVHLGAPDTAHALIAGTSGCGKTTLLRSMIYQAAQADPSEQRILLIDNKGELSDYDNLPHLVCRRIVDPQESVTALTWVEQEILRRADTNADRTPLLVAVDEIAMLTSMAGHSIDPLVRIAGTGRARNVCLVAGTQRVDKNTLGDPSLNANFKLRLAGAVTTAQESVLATGHSGKNAHQLSSAGDFLCVIGNEATRFQAAIVTQQMIDRLPRCAVPEALEIDATYCDVQEAPSTSAAEPVTTDQLAYALAHYATQGRMPGIGHLAKTFGAGKAAGGRAERIATSAADLLSALHASDVDVCAMPSNHVIQ